MLQVQEVNLEERLVLVHFLAQQEPGLFGWDVSRYDTLWEDLEFFTQNSSSVLVEINGMRSTQRCQVFNVSPMLINMFFTACPSEVIVLFGSLLFIIFVFGPCSEFDSSKVVV